MLRATVARVVGRVAGAAGVRGASKIPGARSCGALGQRQMSSLEGTKTLQNLKEAFAAESLASMRYKYFAQVLTLRRWGASCCGGAGLEIESVLLGHMRCEWCSQARAPYVPTCLVGEGGVGVKRRIRVIGRIVFSGCAQAHECIYLT